MPEGGSNQAYFPPTAVPTEVQKELYVMHTDGQGVYLRTSPDGARTKVFAENTKMRLTGQSDSSAGATWYEVTAPDGSSGWVSSKYLDVPPPPTPTPDRSRYQLELLALNAKRSSDWYVTVEGQVKNISSGSIRSVEAVVQWYTSDDKFITSDSSIIDYNPLLAGQTSQFKVLTRYNPQMGRYRIDFKIFMGGTVTMLDSTKR